MQIEVTDNDFEEKVINQSKKMPVVVDFYARWCMPCLTLGPILDDLAKEYEGKFILAKADINSASATALKHGVMSIPTVKMFKHGVVVDEFTGAMPKYAVKEWLDKNL